MFSQPKLFLIVLAALGSCLLWPVGSARADFVGYLIEVESKNPDLVLKFIYVFSKRSKETKVGSYCKEIIPEHSKQEVEYHCAPTLESLELMGDVFHAYTVTYPPTPHSPPDLITMTTTALASCPGACGIDQIASCVWMPCSFTHSNRCMHSGYPSCGNHLCR